MAATGGGLIQGPGCVYQLQAAYIGSSTPDLRWHRRPPQDEYGCAEVVTVRKVIGSLESYEPVQAITAHALTPHRRDPRVSVSVLHAELDRMRASRVVLNRGLREAVLAAVRDGDLTMSEIAIRCGG